MSVQSAVIPTAKSALPQHDGRPVPWVTRWTGEVSEDRISVMRTPEGIFLQYSDGLENRDARGFMWKREGIGRRGEPQYAQLNTYRQRASMLKRLCQICGSKINERPIRWLMDPVQLHAGEDGALTISPPTCSSCIPLALELCPNLRRRGYLIARVLDYEPWGIYGEAIAIDPESGKTRDMRGVFVPFENPPIELTAVVGFQQVVRLTKYVIEDQRDPEE